MVSKGLLHCLPCPCGMLANIPVNYPPITHVPCRPHRVVFATVSDTQGRISNVSPGYLLQAPAAR